MTNQRRLLVVGPVRPDGFVGGIEVAADAVTGSLRQLGWQVTQWKDVWPAGTAARRRSANRIVTSVAPWLAMAAGPFAVETRRLVSLVIMKRGALEDASRQLHALDALLSDAAAFDAVLVLPDFDFLPGAAALAMARHRNAVYYGAGFIAEDRSTRSRWRLGRALARWRLGTRGHSFLFQPLDLPSVRRAAFATRTWLNLALAGGLAPEAGSVIPLGVDAPDGLPDRPSPGRRLLWAGRMVPEKGLHIFIDAIAELKTRIPDLSLTAIAAQGHSGYRTLMERSIRQRGLGDAVRLVPPVPRHELPRWYASHDALCFHSVNAEPTALVLIEAMASGLPVVATRVGQGGTLLRNGETCLGCSPDARADLVRALDIVLTDRALADRLRSAAFAEVQKHFSIKATAEALDRLLAGVSSRST